MSRSACLPDDGRLSWLLARVGVEAPIPHETRRVGLSQPGAHARRPSAQSAASAQATPPSRSGPTPARAADAPADPAARSHRRANPPPANADVDATTVSSRPAPTSATPAELEQALVGCASMQERFAAVSSWLGRATGALRVFVVDADGLTLSGSVDEVYEAAAGDLGMRLSGTRAMLPGVTHAGARLTMASGEHLEVVWCDTKLGQFGVGAVSRSPLPGSWGGMVPGVLRRAVET